MAETCYIARRRDQNIMPSEVESLAKNAIESQVLGIELVFCEISYKFPIFFGRIIFKISDMIGYYKGYTPSTRV